MADYTQAINDLLVDTFNIILKLEEHAIARSTYTNLSITEIHTLCAVGVGEAKSMGQVAAKLLISVSTLSTSINRLVEKRYVKRIRTDEDRRMVMVSHTTAGVGAVEEHEVFHKDMSSKTVESLDEGQKEILIESIKNLRDFFNAELNTYQSRLK